MGTAWMRMAVVGAIRRGQETSGRRCLYLVAWTAAFALVLYPVGMFAIGSFRSAPWGDASAVWSIQGYIDAYSDWHTWKLAGNTLLIATLALVGIMAMSIFFAWL